MAWVNSIIPGGFLAVSLRLPTGDPLGDVGSQVLFRLREVLRSLRLPFVVGGDWNCPPSQLRTVGWVSEVGGHIAACGAATCRKGHVWRELDLFVVSSGLAPSIECVERVQGSCLASHYPVALRLRSHLVRTEYLALAGPR
eukprot:5326889-Pyramimonas_sp.AAC.1